MRRGIIILLMLNFTLRAFGQTPVEWSKYLDDNKYISYIATARNEIGLTEESLIERAVIGLATQIEVNVTSGSQQLGQIVDGYHHSRIDYHSVLKSDVYLKMIGIKSNFDATTGSGSVIAYMDKKELLKQIKEAEEREKEEQKERERQEKKEERAQNRAKTWSSIKEGVATPFRWIGNGISWVGNTIATPFIWVGNGVKWIANGGDDVIWDDYDDDFPLYLGVQGKYDMVFGPVANVAIGYNSIFDNSALSWDAVGFGYNNYYMDISSSLRYHFTDRELSLYAGATVGVQLYTCEGLALLANHCDSEQFYYLTVNEGLDDAYQQVLGISCNYIFHGPGEKEWCYKRTGDFNLSLGAGIVYNKFNVGVNYNIARDILSISMGIMVF